MDVLSDILGLLGLKGTLYFATHFTAPWGILVPAYKNVVRFHLVSRGVCWVRVGTNVAERSIRLDPGDLVLIPHGARHALLDSPERQPAALDRVLADSGYRGTGSLVYGGSDSPEPSRLICGHFSFDESARHPLLATLPQSLVVRATDLSTSAWVDHTLRLLSEEAESRRIGTDAMIGRLTEILFIEILRVWLSRDAPREGLIAALADRRIGLALRSIHEEPSRRWTVDSLARRAGMSRTAFALRFRKLSSMAPLQYVATWRMERARAALAGSNRPIPALANELGYQSLAAFNRAFKKHIGQAPASYRRRATAPKPQTEG